MCRRRVFRRWLPLRVIALFGNQLSPIGASVIIDPPTGRKLDLSEKLSISLGQAGRAQTSNQPSGLHRKPTFRSRRVSTPLVPQERR